MKYFAGVALAILGAILVGCSGNGASDHGAHDHGSKASESTHSDERGAHHDSGSADANEATQRNATCPVMGGEATDPEIFTVYRGVKVFFCCDDCIDKFDRDPETYYAKAYPHASGD